MVGTLGLGEGGGSGITPAEEAGLENIAAEISATERRAMAAERDTVDRLVAHHLASRIGEAFEGRISGVTKIRAFRQPAAIWRGWLYTCLDTGT